MLKSAHAIVGCLVLLPLALMAQSANDATKTAIHSTIDRFIGAWNHHDASAFAAVFTEDADFTNWRGVGASGRSEIEKFHAPLFATIVKNSHLEYADIKLRVIRTDVAAVDVHWKMAGATDPQGDLGPPREGLLSFVMVNSGDTGPWQIAVMHNLDLTALPTSR